MRFIYFFYRYIVRPGVVYKNCVAWGWVDVWEGIPQIRGDHKKNGETMDFTKNKNIKVKITCE